MNPLPLNLRSKNSHATVVCMHAEACLVDPVVEPFVICNLSLQPTVIELQKMSDCALI